MPDIRHRFARLGRLGTHMRPSTSACTPPIQMQEKIAEAPAASRTSINLLLWLLTTRLGTLLLCGRAAITPCTFPCVQSFASLSITRRQAAITSWRTSPLAKLRQARFITLSTIFQHTHVHTYHHT